MSPAVKRRYARTKEWMRQPPVLMRWKIAVTALAVLTLGGGLYYQSNYQDNQRRHDTECLRAEGRDNVRLVLFKITQLSDIFPTSDAIQLYESSMHTIIEAALPEITIKGCPPPQAEATTST